MATCIETIQAGGIPELFAITVTPIAFGGNTNQVFSVKIDQAGTATFSFVFNPVRPLTSFTITATVLQKVGTTYLDLGSVAFSDLVGAFSKDLAVGQFYLCLRSTNDFTGTVVGTWSGFATEARFVPNAYEGATMGVTMADRPPPTPCDEPLFFEHIDGAFPPGLEMTGLGRVYGQLPNLDCLPDAILFSPGMNLSYKDPSGEMSAWGRTWRFKLRVSLQDQPEVKAEEWFCIRVHNNWTFDRDNFLKHAPFKTVREVDVVELPKPILPPGQACFEPCEVAIETPFIPQPLEKPSCPACEDFDVITDIQLIEIPEALKSIDVNGIPAWWDANKDRVFESEQVNRFVRSLRNSVYFQDLLKQAGYFNVTPDPRVVIEATAYQNFLQLTSSTLVDNRKDDHLDAMMLKWKNQQNQRLPIGAVGCDGAHLALELA